MTAVVWNDETVGMLADLWRRGLSAAQISGRIPGSTRSSIIGKVHRLGLPPRGLRTPKPPRVRKQRPSGQHSESRRRAELPGTIERPAPVLRPFVPLQIGEAGPDGRPCTLVELSRNGCKWSVGMREHDHLFCNHRRLDGSPYCPDHAKLAFQPLTPRGFRKRAA